MAVAIAVTRERREGETRCAVTPETVKKLIALGATVAVFQEGAFGIMEGQPIVSFMPIFLIGLVCYLYSFRQRGRVPVAAAAAAAA